MDLVVKGRVWQDGALRRGAVGIRDGRIHEVGEDLRGDVVQDVGDAWVLPGAVDAHVHLRDPGYPEKEDLATGTRSAAFGGITCVLDMPNTDPPTTTAAALEDKLDRVRRRAHVDVGVYAGVTGDPGSLKLLDRATAMKVYLGASTGDLSVEDDALVRGAVEASARHGKVVAFHAEDPACLREHRGELEHAASDDWDAHARARPPGCEVRAIQHVLDLPRPPGSRLHIAHLSTLGGLELLRGTDVTWEVSPHHALLDRDRLGEGPRFLMNPPLRDETHRVALWEALATDPEAMAASDHAPHTLEEKGGSVRDAPAGVPGTETMLPLLLQAAREERLPLAQVLRVCCSNPARRFNLPKGAIRPGYDADLLVVDPDASRPIRGKELHSRCGWTPFEGFDGLFPRQVLVRGKHVVRDGELVGEPGLGTFQDGRPERREGLAPPS